MSQSNNAAVANPTASLFMSWSIAIGLLGTLWWAGGTWIVLGITRLLDPLIEGGIVQYHDTQLGLVPGLPDVALYLKALDPIDWRLVGVSALLLLMVSLLRGVQFRGALARCGVETTTLLAGRAWLHGQGLSRWLPLNAGEIGTTLALKANGIDAGATTRALYLMRLLFLAEIVIFAVVGLAVLGWMPWLAQLFWALVVLGLAWWFLKPNAARASGWGDWASMREGFGVLAEDPGALGRLLVLAMVAFLLEHLSVFLLTMAFTTEHVLMNIPFSLFLMALVAGFVARLVPLTPGGLGQFEWGFAMALYIGGIGMPESAASALMFTALRYVVSFAVEPFLRLAQGAPETRTVIDVLAGRRSV